MKFYRILRLNLSLTLLLKTYLISRAEKAFEKLLPFLMIRLTCSMVTLGRKKRKTIELNVIKAEDFEAMIIGNQG